MPEFRSALAAHVTPGRFGAGDGEAPLVLSERPLGTLIQIAGWPGGFETAAGAVLKALGFDGVGGYGVAQSSGDALAFRIAPERVLIRLPARTAWDKAAANLDPAATPVLDFSHARTVIGIDGAAAADLIARFLPIDLHDSVFGPGRFALSGLHAVPVMLHRRADGGAGPAFELYAPYTWAASVWESLTESAAPFGYTVIAG
jgi:heterotetrameric sarcosine oxidase gamma subunit